ncbi:MULTISPECIES: hypothetical protein [Roseivirga]|uniref:hypothetical protein n=1 Tax=Roseivirga TaxID=290180 RepID=UPI00257986C1|nr:MULTISPECIES: hypothetical protein [Roseivirga]MEC7755173.1 hypothetical protein [Bacteroidota bacterium]|tara:strand:+ start:1392 stop:2219 length:828 start_codon:yes stop_codon:yes gene_type:complete
MTRKRILLTVTTYPLPSRSYDELVCTAGILENGEWIRIYPVPLSFLLRQRASGDQKLSKYTWMELDLKRRTDDFRPESYSPKNYDFRDLNLSSWIDTKQNWSLRKTLCLKNVYTNLKELINDSKAPKNKSLATFKPTTVIKLEIEEDDPEWKSEWKELRKQGDLFSQDKEPEILIPKIPFKFYYRFTDDSGKSSRLMIEDWEIGQLYWNCLRSANGDKTIALSKVRERYEEEFINTKELYFFLGTTKQWHTRRATNPFVIIGVFYPKKESQMRLF